MEHYYKGKNQEEFLTKENIPIPNLPENFAWIEVTGSSRVRSLVSSLHKILKQEKSLVISGCGNNTTKAVTLAEIIKRRQKHVQERLALGERVVQEFWEPKHEVEGLDTLVVTRRIPTIHILLDINKTSTQLMSQDEELYNAMWANESTNGGLKRNRQGRKANESKKDASNVIQSM